MTSPKPQNDRPTSDPPVVLPAAPAAAVEPDSFVINLCSSTTPMALTQPQLAELKRYKFFVSRRLEDGRERFRLHMGYFDSQLQAEDLLPLVRDLYPGAWAGEAPGKRLRARAAAPAQPAPVVPVPVVTPTLAAAPELPEAPDASLLASAPTLNAEDIELTLLAPSLALPEPTPVPMPMPTPAPTPPAPPAPSFELELVAEAAPPSAPEAPAPEVAAAPIKPVEPLKEVAPVKHARRSGVSKSTPSKRDTVMPFEQRSNVREVLKSLESAPAATAKAAPVAAPAPREAGPLPEAQVLRLLEEKRGDPLNTTSTPAAFAVQLQWSVQPIDLAQVPALAIFGAYMLYTVEGSREGRKWYGLRLGFFTDANSAKTVAQYVRSEFTSVAVVPVSLRERDGATGANNGKASPAPTETPPAASPVTERLPDQSAEFKLLDDTAERRALTDTKAASAPAAAKLKAAGIKGGPRTAGAKAPKPRAGRVHANEKRGPKTLEETLEILGADQLQIEGAKKKRSITEGAVRHVDVKVQKNSAFSRLLDRLAERKG